MYVVQRLSLIIFLLFTNPCLLLVKCDVSDRQNELPVNLDNSTISNHNDMHNANVTILGLGSMGMAIVKCLASKSSMIIHAWNRGDEKRQQLQSLAYHNVHVHDNINNAIQSSNIIVTMIDDWNGTTNMMYESMNDMSNSSNNDLVWSTTSSGNNDMIHKFKTLVLFSTYTPHDIKTFQRLVERFVHVWGGAIVGVPQTIGTPLAFILSSSSSDDDHNITSSSSANQNTMIINMLNQLGTHVHFEGDIGLASLANIALIQTITFGIAGHELVQLLLQQYNHTNGIVKYELFMESYNSFVIQIVPKYITMLLPLISKGQSYVPMKTFYHVTKMHYQFMDEIGIMISDTYLHGYIQSLEKHMTNHKNRNNDDETQQKMGPAHWIRSALSVTTSTSNDPAQTIDNESKNDEL